MNEFGFKGIVGHKDIIAHLQHAITGGKVSHAYIFAGEIGSGKMRMANAFASALVCEKGGSEPCGRCEACLKFLHGNHPDVIRVTHEKPNIIRVDEIREQLVATADRPPVGDRFKVYIIDEADKMNPQAQNAALKSIEEPADRTVILLLSSRPESLLPTIRSRCIRLDFGALTRDEITDYLVKELRIPLYEAEVAAAYAQGNLGRAKQAAEGDLFSAMAERAVRAVRQARHMAVYEMADFIRDLEEDKAGIDDFLDVMLLWLKDVLLYKATFDPDGIIFRRDLIEIRREAEESSYEGLKEAIDAVNRCRERLRANVSFSLALELLMMTLRDDIG